MSNIEIKKYFEEDPNFETYDELMRKKALSWWAEQSGTNYHELPGDVFDALKQHLQTTGK